jgi:large subunit ribosomal protein L23
MPNSKTHPPINAKVSPIKKFHVTEKAGILSESNAYAFEVAKTATKNQVLKEVIKLYKVTPIKVNMINVKPKKVFARGKRGQTTSMKKAYVFLKKGDTIDIA